MTIFEKKFEGKFLRGLERTIHGEETFGANFPGKSLQGGGKGISPCMIWKTVRN